ncbi:MAG: glycine zipper 2TM domain-containing protein [Hyphomicrobiaceae bacterium]|nr:glycine zipper 2TM domain-containing protein [Hyphomicrobiaceae bacterium]
MIQKPVRMIAVLLMPLLIGLAGCGGGPREDMGTVVGAVAGGAIGNQFGKGDGRTVATIAGILIGGIIGSDIGRQLDENDRRRASRAEYTALESGRSGEPSEWRNPDSGHYGRIVPQRPYKIAGRDCRNYTHTIYIGGQPETMRGRACRNQDGSWSRSS